MPGKRGPRSARPKKLEPVTPRNTSSGINNDRLFHSTMFGSWEHDANRRSFKDILDAGAVLGATQYDPAESVRALQILIGRMLRTRLGKTKIQPVGDIEW